VRDANKSEKGEKVVEGGKQCARALSLSLHTHTYTNTHTHAHTGGQCRVGWAMDRVAFEDLEAPIGYSPDMDEEEVIMVSYVNM
jgi:hypothetical protein